MIVLTAHNQNGAGKLYGVYDSMDIVKAQIITQINGDAVKIGKGHYNVVSELYDFVYTLQWHDLNNIGSFTKPAQDLILTRLS